MPTPVFHLAALFTRAASLTLAPSPPSITTFGTVSLRALWIPKLKTLPQHSMSSYSHLFTRETVAAFRDFFALGVSFVLGYVSHLSSLIRRTLTSTSAQLALRAIYDVCFHPLANCPGPFVAKISRIPNLYHAIKGDRHIWIWQNHQIYGK